MRSELRYGLAAVHVLLALALLASLALVPSLTIPLLLVAVVLTGVTTAVA